VCLFTCLIAKPGLVEKTLQFSIEIILFIFGRGERVEKDEDKREHVT